MSRRYFYKAADLATVVSDDQAATVVRTPALILGELEAGVTTEQTALVAVDGHNSALNNRGDRSYSAYGFHVMNSAPPLVGFNGQRRDEVIDCDLLGNGTRSFNPVLMRFCMPDILSPFGRGGLNAYAYCGGDPINFVDPSGRGKTQPWNTPVQTEALDLSMRSRTIAKMQQNRKSATQYAPPAPRSRHSPSAGVDEPQPGTSNAIQSMPLTHAGNRVHPGSLISSEAEQTLSGLAHSIVGKDISQAINDKHQLVQQYLAQRKPTGNPPKYAVEHMIVGLAIASEIDKPYASLTAFGSKLPLPKGNVGFEFADAVLSLRKRVDKKLAKK